MFNNQTIYIGVDPTGGQRPFTLAVLDDDLHLVALRQGELDEMLAYVGGQQQAWVAVSAPQRPNQGLMGDPESAKPFRPAQTGALVRFPPG